MTKIFAPHLQRLHDAVQRHVLGDVDDAAVQVHNDHVEQVRDVVLVRRVHADNEGGGGGQHLENI